MIRILLATFARALAPALGVALACLLPSHAPAHDVPADVRVQMFVRPAGDALQLLVRVPLAAMREVDVPRRGPGYLDLARAEPALREAAALWIADNLEIREGESRLAYPRIAGARVTLPSDRSFGTFEEALAHLRSPRLPESTDLYWSQQLLDVLLEYPIASDQSAFSVHPRLARLGLKVTTTLRFLPPGGAERAFTVSGDPGLVHLDPRWHQAALRFLESGFLHILGGADHLLFILCLVIPFRRLVPLAVIVTAFTVAHSLTLASAVLGYAPAGLWFPPLVETLIAVSILWMAVENIFGANVGRRWIVAFAFGLAHGYGFAFGLKEEMQFAGDHLATALVAFNVGVELGQLAVLLVLVPALDLLLRRAVPERAGTIVLSAFVAHTAWHWTIERGEDLRRFPLPAPDAAAMAEAMRWGMVLMAIAGLAWLIAVILRRDKPPAAHGRERNG